MSSLLKTLNKNQNEKFNPDVANLYNKTNQTRNTIKYNFTNEGYKTIINDNLPKIIKSKEDLKINYEKISSKDLPVINKKITELEYERQMEKEKLVKQIDHNKKLDELIKIKRRELTGDKETYQAATHSELKQFQINQNDKAKKEKEKFNSIVESLNIILK
jgi:hypothetical protein